MISLTRARHGGGIATGPGSAAAATFTDSTLAGNTATTGSGGGIYSQGGTATLTGTPVNDNTAPLGNGGGIATIDAVLTLTSSPVSDNAAAPEGGSGGGVYRIGGTVTVTTSAISANTPNNCTGSNPAMPPAPADHSTQFRNIRSEPAGPPAPRGRPSRPRSPCPLRPPPPGGTPRSG